LNEENKKLSNKIGKMKKMNNLNKIKEQSKTIKKQISDVFQEKVELEEIVIQQEERVSQYLSR